MNKVGRGRGSGGQKGKGGKGAPRPLLIPKASALTPAASSTSGQPVEAPVELSVLQWVKVAGKVLDGFGAAPLWQIQVRHEGKPCVTMQLVRHFIEYLTILNAADASVPATLHDLRDHASIVLQLAGGTVPWRCAWYVEGDAEALQNALRLILGFVEHRSRDLAGALSVRLALDQRAGALDVDTLPSAPGAVRGASFSPWAAAPPSGSQTLTLQLEFQADDKFCGVLAGATWPFRTELEQAGIYGARVPEDGSYVRVLPSTTIDAAGKSWLLETILRDIFVECVLHLRVASAPAADSEGHALLTAILALPYVYADQ